MMKLISSLLSLAAFSSQAIVPLTINAQHNLTINVNINKQDEARILNLEDSIRHALYFAYQDENPDSNVSNVSFTKDVVHMNPSGELIGKASYIDIPNATYFGVSIFENNFDIAQNFLTPEFKKTVTDTLSSSVKIGINNATKLDFKFGSDTFKFEYNSIKTNTHKEETSHTSPSLTVKVAPHTKIKVTIFLAATEMKGNVRLNEDIQGSVNALITDQNGTHKYNVGLGHVFKGMEKKGILPPEITIKSENEIHFTGLGEISSLASSEQFSKVIEKI